MTFWNKVQSGVSRAAAEAERQGKITRINLQIGEVQNVIRGKQRELGEAAVKLAQEGKLSDPTVDPIVQSIAEQEQRIAELRNELAAVQGSASPPEPSA